MILLDKSSEHSTIRVTNCFPNTKESVCPRKVKAQRPCARINEQLNQCYEDSERCAEDCIDTWYQPQDFARFKADRKNSLSQFNEESLQQHLFDVYQTLCKVDFVCSECSPLWTASQENELRKLIHEQEVVGLEYLLVSNIRQDALDRREAIQDIVDEIQTEHTCGLWTDFEAQHELRECCATYTQVSALFSQMVAKAQECSF